MKEYTNEQLITLARSTGDERYLTMLYNQVIKFVHSQAHKYKTGIDHEELISVGYIALAKAINTFDTDSGYTFTTYLGCILLNEFNMLNRSYQKHLKLGTVLSLDKPAHDMDMKGIVTLLDAIPDESTGYEEFDSEISVQHIHQVLNEVLDESELMMIMSRSEGLTQKAVANQLHLSQAHVSRKFKALETKLQSIDLRRLLYES